MGVISLRTASQSELPITLFANYLCAFLVIHLVNCTIGNLVRLVVKLAESLQEPLVGCHPFSMFQFDKGKLAREVSFEDCLF